MPEKRRVLRKDTPDGYIITDMLGEVLASSLYYGKLGQVWCEGYASAKGWVIVAWQSD